MDGFLFVFAVEEILRKLGSITVDGISLAWGLRGDLKRLRDSTTKIQRLLRDAVDKQSVDERVKSWLVKLQDVAYEADDVLDKFAYWTLKKKVKGKVHVFFSFSNPAVFHLSMACKVKNINDSLADIKKQAIDELKLIEAIEAAPDHRVNQTRLLDRETVHHLDTSQMVGRKGEVSTIIDWLVGLSNQNQRLAVFTIVGMAGLGKTTLAKLVYKEAKDKQLFDETIWICVSENFDKKKILVGILQNLDAHAATMESLEAILKHLEDRLQRKRFLLVLDDVWSEDSDMLGSLKGNLEHICGTNSGNAIVVTTRSGKVASIMETGTGCRLELEQLSDDDCWYIIKEKVSEGGSEQIPPELKAIGKMIAVKCGGVPLAANVLGGTLQSKKEEEEWLSIRDSNIWESSDHNRKILSILKLSFDHLPSYLKPCFAYSSVFPKDYYFIKEQLIQQWMAEGFLDSSCGGNKVMEDIGDEFVNKLITNFFFQDVDKDIYGNVEGFKMHDLVHELALSVSANETFVVKDDCSHEEIDISNHHRLILSHYKKPTFTYPRSGTNKLHSLFYADDVILNSLLKFPSLRTLVLRGREVTEVSASIGKLKHLRFLDISWSSIKALPKSITKLYNLQTLVIYCCESLEKLPGKMSNLVSLRHIYLSPKHMPAKVGCLTSLRTLPYFVVGPKEGYRIEELGELNELRGELQIMNLEHVRDKEEAMRAKLSEKKKISTLTYMWSKDEGRQVSSQNEEDVLEGLKPPPSIVCLSIEDYMGKKFPLWMTNLGDSFNKLVQLYLLSCKDCEGILTLGDLPLLQILKIYICSKLIALQGLKFCMSLKKFDVRSCKGLTSIPSVQSLTSLQELEIVECDKLTVIPAGLKYCTSLQQLSIVGCKGLISIPEDSRELPSSLVFLKINYCRSLSDIPNDMLCNLTHLKKLEMGPFSEELEEFPALNSIQNLNLASLEELKINGWDKLKSLPHQLQHLTSLKSLDIWYFNGLEALPEWFSNFSSLQLLQIDTCPKIIAFQELKFCTSLQKLHISNFEGLTSIPSVQSLTSLQELEINRCHKLTVLPNDMLCNLIHLKKLFMGPFSDELEEFPALNSIQNLNLASLEVLRIHGWDKLKSFPHQLQHLTSLKSLHIWYFNGLEALPEWFSNLSSLQWLDIHHCKNLMYIPTSMQRLSNLKTLRITRCPLLEERCAKGRGPEWPNISNIQNISINYKTIQST